MKDITPLLQQLAAQLQVTVGELWGVLLAQASLWALYHALWILVVLAGVLVAFRGTRGWNELKDEAIIIRVVASIIGAVTIVYNLYWSLTNLLNPRYAALSWLIDRLR